MNTANEQRDTGGVGRSVVDIALAPVAFFLLAVGGMAFAGAWSIGPQRWLDAHRLAAMSERVEARITETFWWLDLDLDLHSRLGGNWRPDAQLSLCVSTAYAVDDKPFHRVLCSLPYRLHGSSAFGVIDFNEIVSGLDAAWPRDATGNPIVELRMTPDLHAYLTAQPALSWPLVGQTAEVRDKVVPGTELDYLWLEFDRPLEWLVRLWPPQPDPKAVLAYRAGDPAQTWPESLTTIPAPSAADIFSGLPLVLIGAVAWAFGVMCMTLFDSKRTRIVIALVSVLLLPMWDGPLGTLLRWASPKAYWMGADMLSDVRSGSALPVTFVPEALFSGMERTRWRVAGGDSYYGSLLAEVGLHRPDPPPADADAALRAAVAQASAFVERLPDGEAAAFFDKLTYLEVTDRHEIGVLFLQAGSETALLGARGEQARKAAHNFVEWFSLLPPRNPQPDQPALRARVEQRRQLFGFPEAIVDERARQYVERAERR